MAWRNFKNIFSRPLFTRIFMTKMVKFHPYFILLGKLWEFSLSALIKECLHPNFYCLPINLENELRGIAMFKEKIDCLPKLKKLGWAHDLSWGYTCQTDSEKRSTICSKVFILSRLWNMKPFLITSNYVFWSTCINFGL